MVMLLPIIQFYLMCLTIGRPLTSISLGIFNGENIDCTSDNYTYYCHSEGLSCLFIDAISDKVFHKIFFTDFDDAFMEARVGNIMMDIPSNFTNELMKRGGQKESEKYIKIYLDYTNIVQFQFAKLELMRAYDDFIANVMAKCNHSLKYHQNQMVFTNEKGDKYEKSIDFQLLFIPTMYLV